VLLVHGIASSAYSWAEVIPALAAAHDVIALDLPGC
jgi:pimeloyl-ACP methyl ester carboxylesterase